VDTEPWRITTFYSNALAGVEIKTGGEALIRGNRIHDGKGSGVYVHDGGRGTLEDNDVFGNERVGVRISKNSDATLRGNRINRNAHEGINVSAGSSATVEDNNLTGNIRGPWRIAADSTQNVTRARNKES
jgi:parallel beta-helix repeat protein